MSACTWLLAVVLWIAVVVATGAHGAQRDSGKPAPEHVAFEVPVRSFEPGAGVLEIAATGGSVDGNACLFLADNIGPFGWFRAVEMVRERARFQRAGPIDARERLGKLRAWVVPVDVAGRLRARWPAGAAFCAAIESAGPGNRNAWIARGAREGMRGGESYWLRLGGQPVARFDVRLVEPDLTHCGVVPLVAELPPLTDRRVELWPAPGAARRGAVHSAVASVEERNGQRRVWVAAPPAAECPSEPHVDFFRAGRLVGCGVVEERDERFWYARLLEGATPPERPETAHVASSSPSTSRPAEGASLPTVVQPSPSAGSVRVGDDVIVRSTADINARRFVARVFEATAEGYVINAGEPDGLTLDQEGVVYRAGRAIGTVRIQRVQRGYAIVRLVSGAGETELQLGDEVRFGPPPRPPRLIGLIERVVGEDLLAVNLVPGAEAPTQRPLAIRDGLQTAGVALLVVVEGRHGIGFALAPSITQPLTPGMELVLDEEEAAGG